MNISLREPADLIGMIPHLVEHHLTDSLVVVTVCRADDSPTGVKRPPGDIRTSRAEAVGRVSAQPKDGTAGHSKGSIRVGEAGPAPRPPAHTGPAPRPPAHTGPATCLGPMIRADCQAMHLAYHHQNLVAECEELLAHDFTIVRLVPVVFSDAIARLMITDTGSGPDLPLICRGMDHVVAGLSTAGFAVDEPMWVGHGVWGFFSRPDHVHDLAHAEASPAVCHMIAHGSAPLASSTELVSPPIAADCAEAALLAAKREQATSTADHFAAVRDLVVRAAELAETGTSARLVTLITADMVVAVESVVGAMWARDGLQMMLSFDHPEFLPRELHHLSGRGLMQRTQRAGRSLEAAAQLTGLSTRRPDPHALNTSVRILDHIAARVTPGARPALLALAAWYEWALCRNSRAEIRAQAALALDPDYSLAKLIVQAVRRGLKPGWLRAPDQDAKKFKTSIR